MTRQPAPGRIKPQARRRACLTPTLPANVLPGAQTGFVTVLHWSPTARREPTRAGRLPTSRKQAPRTPQLPARKPAAHYNPIPNPPPRKQPPRKWPAWKGSPPGTAPDWSLSTRIRNRNSPQQNGLLRPKHSGKQSGQRQRDARDARLAARSPALDRAEPGEPAPSRTDTDSVRRQFQLLRGARASAGGVRPQPGRQEGQEADHLRLAVRRGRLPGRRGGVCRQHQRSGPGVRAGRAHPGAVPDRAGGAGGWATAAC